MLVASVIGVVVTCTMALSFPVPLTALMKVVAGAVEPAVTFPVESTVANAVVLDHVMLGAGVLINESLASNTESTKRIVLSCRTRDVSSVVGCSLTLAPACCTVTELGAKKDWK